MRFFLLALALAASAAPQGTRPFSHRLHLKLVPECTSCHSAALTSTKPVDNLLPTRQLCLKCHRDVTIPTALVVRVVHFSHTTHAKLGNIASVIAAAIDSGKYLSTVPPDLRKSLNTKNACAGCHRGMETSDRVTRAAMPQMADCLVCHSQISPPDSCTQCHGDDRNLKPANHTADFVDTHTSPATNLDKSGCAVCHGRTFTCRGCH